ncbi:hypothetical protein P5Y53_14075 [Dyella jiangningensis]|uniref:hypothetical protein n=1 Tax=Dyella jiangningensis TaxID=1379159 RepID=UPI00240F4EE1|nr:hypothetical protein [Dyella jiangningensis]MDG2538799.1 hypothetical protein [Dyella jiangningensis]
MLGFVIGTSGGVPPSIVGSVLVLIALVIYRHIRTPLLWLAQKRIVGAGRA